MKTVCENEIHDHAAHTSRNDQERLARAFQEVYRRLYNYAYRLVRNASDAEDLVSEAQLRVLRAIDSLNSLEPAAVRNFTCRVITRLYLDQLRTKRRRIDAAPLDEESESFIPCEDAAQAIEDIETALNAQPIPSLKELGQYREVALWAMGASGKEIGAQTGCSPQLARNRVTRGRARLRPIIAQIKAETGVSDEELGHGLFRDFKAVVPNRNRNRIRS